VGTSAEATAGTGFRAKKTAAYFVRGAAMVELRAAKWDHAEDKC
jgi:hypothetical protein